MNPHALAAAYAEGRRVFVAANLNSAHLHRAFLQDADLTAADLFQANLHEAWLYDANLTRAMLFGANLTGAQLCGACFEGANLSGATLHGAILDRANFAGANLTGARFTSRVHKRAAFDTRTVWPRDPRFLEGATIDELPLAAAVAELGSSFSVEQFDAWSGMYRAQAQRIEVAPGHETGFGRV